MALLSLRRLHCSKGEQSALPRSGSSIHFFFSWLARAQPSMLSQAVPLKPSDATSYEYRSLLRTNPESPLFNGPDLKHMGLAQTRPTPPLLPRSSPTTTPPRTPHKPPSFCCVFPPAHPLSHALRSIRSYSSTYLLPRHTCHSFVRLPAYWEKNKGKKKIEKEKKETDTVRLCRPVPLLLHVGRWPGLRRRPGSRSLVFGQAICQSPGRASWVRQVQYRSELPRPWRRPHRRDQWEQPQCRSEPVPLQHRKRRPGRREHAECRSQPTRPQHRKCHADRWPGLRRRPGSRPVVFGQAICQSLGKSSRIRQAQYRSEPPRP